MELTQLAVYAVLLLLILVVPNELRPYAITIIGCLIILFEYASTCLTLWVEYVRPSLIQILRSPSVKFGTLVLLMCAFIYFVVWVFRQMVVEVENRRLWNYKYKDMQFVKRVTKQEYEDQAEHYTRKKLDELSAELQQNYY